MWWNGAVDQHVEAAAEVFRALGSPVRLQLLHLLSERNASVSELVAATNLSQPLVSQHLRTLRQVGVVAGDRDGRVVTYRLSDQHVAHIVADALAHVAEPTERNS